MSNHRPYFPPTSFLRATPPTPDRSHLAPAGSAPPRLPGSTPVKSKASSQYRTIGPIGYKVKTHGEVQKVVAREVMDATFHNVKGLIEKRFPDGLFERLLRSPCSEDKIELVPHDQYLQTTTGRNTATGEHIATGENETTIEHTATGENSITGEQVPPSTSNDGYSPSSLLDEILAHFKSSRDGSALYDEARQRWIDWPQTNTQGKEDEIAKYLNTVVDRSKGYLETRRPAEEATPEARIFSAQHANRPVKSDGAEQGPVRKPDISLLPREDVEKTRWRDIISVGEVKSNANFGLNSATPPLADKARLIFGSQKSRRFVLCFSLFDTRLRLWKFDRSGVLSSSEVDVHRDPISFLRITLGMALGDDYYLGYDPSFTFEDGVEYVYINKKKYRIIEELQIDAVIRGRGTVILIVEDVETHERYIVKDQWVDRSRESKEFEMLKKVNDKNIKNVPRVIDYQAVGFRVGLEGTVLDTTESDRDTEEMRGAVEKENVETRDHYRLIIWPVGRGLEQFNSLKDLVMAFRTFMRVIGDLHEAGIVHRDFSPRNLILVEIHDRPEQEGYVIDFDYAVELERNCLAQAERTGTFPFMAIDVLKDSRTNHRYYHDIESAFYVLLWICLTQAGPRGQKRPDSELTPGNNPLHQWCGKDDELNIKMIANTKIAMMVSDSQFKDEILVHLPSYFKPLKKLLRALRRIIFVMKQTPDSDADNDANASQKSLPMKSRKPEDVFNDLDRAFVKALAKLPTEPPPPPPPGNDRLAPISAQESVPVDDDSGVYFVSGPLLSYPNMRILNHKEVTADLGQESGVVEGSNLHLELSSHASGSRGGKRSRDLAEEADPFNVSSSLSKRPRGSGDV